MTISRNRPVRWAAMALGAVTLLGGCAHREKDVATAGAMEAPATPPAADQAPVADGLTPTQRLARVVELLNQNDEKAASAELKTLLRQEPNRREALVLQRSIEGNPYDLVPRGSFSYIVAPGDTFVTLALDYLGDSYKFYALARIAQIAPNALKPGDTIQIPGRLRDAARPGAPRVRAPFQRPRSTPRRSAPATTAAPAGTAPATPQSDPAAALRLRRQGLERMTAGQINSAVDRLSRAQQLDPGNRAIAADLARARRIQGAVRTRQ